MKQFNLKTQSWEGGEETETLNALSYLQSIYRNPMEPTGVRIRAAVKALAYEQPKLSAVAVGYLTGQDFAAQLERAVTRSDRARAPKLIDARAEPVSGGERRRAAPVGDTVFNGRK